MPYANALWPLLRCVAADFALRGGGGGGDRVCWLCEIVVVVVVVVLVCVVVWCVVVCGVVVCV